MNRMQDGLHQAKMRIADVRRAGAECAGRDSNE